MVVGRILEAPLLDVNQHRTKGWRVFWHPRFRVEEFYAAGEKFNSAIFDPLKPTPVCPVRQKHDDGIAVRSFT